MRADPFQDYVNNMPPVDAHEALLDALATIAALEVEVARLKRANRVYRLLLAGDRQQGLSSGFGDWRFD